MRKDPYSTKGFSLVEVIVSSAIFLVVVGAFSTALIATQGGIVTAGARQRAVILAHEGLEAARNIRDASFANLSNGTYGLSTFGSQWGFVGTPDVSDIFTRTISIGIKDSNTKRVTSTVTWLQNTQLPGSVTLVTNLTNWRSTGGIGNWANPNTLAGSLDLAGTDDGFDIAQSGNYLYVIRAVSGSTNFQIIDVTTPATPTAVGSLTLVGTPQEIAVSGLYAYIASSNNASELQIVNVTTPASPTLAGSYDATGNGDGTGIFVTGTTVYLGRATGNGEFSIINASTPATPTLIGQLSTGQTEHAVTVLGSYAYMVSADNVGEVISINISTPATPVLAGTLNLAGNQDAVSIVGFGSTIVVGRADSTLYVIDVTTPATPTTLGSVAVGGRVNDISLGNSNTYAFLATTNATADFRVVDISTPATPSIVGEYNASATLNGIVYDSTADRAYAVGTDNALELYVIQP